MCLWLPIASRIYIKNIIRALCPALVLLSIAFGSSSPAGYLLVKYMNGMGINILASKWRPLPVERLAPIDLPQTMQRRASKHETLKCNANGPC